MENKPFIGLEDEIELRRSIRAVHKSEGIAGVYTVMGELAKALEIVATMAQELLDDEEDKKK